MSTGWCSQGSIHRIVSTGYYPLGTIHRIISKPNSCQSKDIRWIGSSVRAWHSSWTGRLISRIRLRLGMISHVLRFSLASGICRLTSTVDYCSNRELTVRRQQTLSHKRKALLCFRRFRWRKKSGHTFGAWWNSGLLCRVYCVGSTHCYFNGPAQHFASFCNEKVYHRHW